MAKNAWSRFQSTLFAIPIVVLLLVACERQEEPTPVAAPSVAAKQTRMAASLSPALPDDAGTKPAAQVAVLLKESIDFRLLEEQAEGLPLWRRFAAHKPTLLLFSAQVLSPLPETLRADVDLLLRHADDKELVRRVARPVSDQVMAPDLGIAAAMRQGYFSRVIWVVPLEAGTEMLPLSEFKEGMRQRAAGWGKDIDGFEVTENGAYSGMLGGVPVDVVSIDRLPIVKEPILVHVDAGFFTAIYRNEVKTPLLDLLSGHFKRVAARGYRSLGVSISRANLSFDVPLLMRFLGDDMAALISNPALLDRPTMAMKLRGEMRYLDSFFQPEAIIERAQALQKLAPRDADSFYSQYRARRQLKQLEQGLPALEKAISLDAFYALEYFELANQAVKQGQKEDALAMLDKAIRALPDHALIGLRKAELLVEMGRGGEAVPLLNKLGKLSWSEFYYPEIRQRLRELSAQAADNEKPR